MAKKTITYTGALPMRFRARSTGRSIPVKTGDKLTAGQRIEVPLPSGRTGGFDLRPEEIAELADHPDFGGPTTAAEEPPSSPAEPEAEEATT